MTENPIKLKVTYSREGSAVYLSHLDAVDVLCRGIRRAQLPYRISQGCHVRPKVAFGPPLPLGHASRCEYFQLHLQTAIEPSEVFQRLRDQLPTGFRILTVAPWSKDEPTGNKIRYQLQFRSGAAETVLRARAFLGDSQRVITMHRGDHEERLLLGQAVLALEEALNPAGPSLVVDFQQGIKGVPSAGRILTALAEELGPAREDLLAIERIAFLP